MTTQHVLYEEEHTVVQHAALTEDAKEQSLEQTPPTLLLAVDPNTAMEQTLSTVDALHRLLKEETQALQDVDLDTIEALQSKKMALAQDYQSAIAQILERADDFRDVRPNLKEKLQTKHAQFRTLTLKNEDALKNTGNSIKRLVNRILQVARKTLSEDQTGYSQKGTLNVNERASISMAAIDQTL